jgi:hypothetical protein
VPGDVAKKVQDAADSLAGKTADQLKEMLRYLLI